jgi:hypothetical protein
LFKGTSLSLAKNGIVGKSKKEESMRVFSILHCSFGFYEILKEPLCLRERNGNCNVFADSHWAILPCLLLSLSFISWIFHHTQLIRIFARRYLCYLGISQRLSNTLSEFSMGYSVTFVHFPAAVGK